MKVCKLFLAILILTITVFSDSKKNKIYTIAKIEGLYEIVNEQRIQLESNILKQTDLLVEQLKKQTNINKKAQEEILKVTQRNMESIKNDFDSVDTLIGKWVDLYSEQVSEQDVDSLLAFYHSSSGQRSIKASKIAAKAWGTYIMQRSQEKSMTRIKSFSAEIQQIVQKYR
jgi:hypothetical protein